MRSSIFVDDGSIREGKTRVRTSGVTPRSDTLEVYPGENVDSIVRRAYGTNTEAYRDKLIAANNKLEGKINVPR